MDWRELSTVNFGLILEGRQPPTLYKSEWFSTPYDQGVEVLLQKGATREDVAKVLSSVYISDAHDAVHKWNGVGDKENFDWQKSLREAYDNFERGRKFEKIARKFKENEPVDLLPLHGELTAAINQGSTGLRPASEIDFSHYKPFKATGYSPIDSTIGGIPSDGPIIIYGLTGVGKSKFATRLIDSLLHKHPKDTAAIYTLEMNAEHWLHRSMKLYPTLRDVMDRLHISGSVRDIDEMVAEVVAGKFSYVVLDDMDNMVKSSDASEYERIYRRVKEICRFMGIPVFVLGQPNRLAKFSSSGKDSRFLGPYDVAWSGAAENSAALLVALQTTNGLDMAAETFPTSDSNMDYLIFWKSRDGWPGNYDPKLGIGPGAVVMEHSSNWLGKPYGGKWKLWPVASANQKIGNRKRKED